MKVSIITVTYNAAEFLNSCIQSVIEQDYSHIEHIIVDGKSTDGTLEIITSYQNEISTWVSEPDDGIYDAMNKGISMATGEVIGILNADDFYVDSQVITKIVNSFIEHKVDSVFGDLVYINPGEEDKIVRYYRGAKFNPEWFSQGKMPPHPTFFVKRGLYENYGNFLTNYHICSDFEIMLRFLKKHQASYHYLPEVMVKMRTGGRSSWGIQNTILLNKEMLDICKKHNVSTNWLKIYSKYFTKVFQLVQKPAMEIETSAAK